MPQHLIEFIALGFVLDRLAIEAQRRTDAPLACAEPFSHCADQNPLLGRLQSFFESTS